MRASLLAAIAAVVLSPANARADDPADQHVAASKTLLLAMAHDESSYIRGVFAAKVSLVNLAFDDLACNKAFGRGKRRTVTRKQHAKLAVCLLGARWRPAAGRDSVVDASTPHPRLVIEDDAVFTGIRTEITFHLDRDGFMRIDRIERVDPPVADGVVDGDIDGVPGGVWDGVGDINGSIATPPPPPPPPPPATTTPPKNVSPTAIEALRIAGDKYIEPDDVTRIEINRAGKARVVASLKMCLDAAGAVTSVKLLKSSGFPAYDSKLLRGVKTWGYQPFLIDGAPAPVCTAVTFLFSAK